jgi:hypothetical protein
VYRIGNGDAGNIGADALAHLVSPTISDASALRRKRSKRSGKTRRVRFAFRNARSQRTIGKRS